MDFNIECIDTNRIALSHYGSLNGDAMADPDITFTVDVQNKLLIPETYQNDYVGVFQTREDGAHFCNDVNYYTTCWLKNIKDCKYKIKEIHNEKGCHYIDQNPMSFYKVCKDYGIQKFAINPIAKEAER